MTSTARDRHAASVPDAATGVATPINRRPNRASAIDPLSDRATQALIRKVLLPQESGDKGRDTQTPINELLPPLTSRNDVDVELYAFLAILLREFVQSWYNKVTTDETFVAEVLHIIAHCTRTLEQRLRSVDLETLLFHEIPEVLNKHIATYRSSHQCQSSPFVHVNGREAYHALWPLPPLSPVPTPGDPLTTATQLKSESAYRHLLVEAVLSVLLPTEDLENPCLTALVGQIFSELVIGNIIAGKAAQPWLLFEAICIAERVLREKKQSKSNSMERSDRLAHKSSPAKWSVQRFFVSILQLVFVLISSVRLAFGLITMSSSLPPREVAADTKRKTAGWPLVKDDTAQSSNSAGNKVPVLSFNAWGCLGNVVELQARMPWLGGVLSLLQHGAVHGPGHVAKFDGLLDRLLSSRIRLLFSASHLPPVLRSLRGVLFPNNAPGSSTLTPPASDAELSSLRRRAARAFWDLLPGSVARVYLGGSFWQAAHITEEDMIDEVEGWLEVLGDAYCNKHLMYSILEIILVRLMPELGEYGVEELLEERLGKFV